jgi:hypothetical protein
MKLTLDLVDLLEVKANRVSFNQDLRDRGLDLRLIYLSPSQVETFDSFSTDLNLQVDDDGFVSVRS